MFSCSHFSNFLSGDPDQIGKQSAMSKRGQISTSSDGSPTATAKPGLVLRKQRSEDISSRSLGSLVNPENADERKEVARATRQLVLIQKPDIHKRVDKRILRKQAGNWCWTMKTKQKVMRENILTPRAQGNLQQHHQS